MKEWVGRSGGYLTGKDNSNSEDLDGLIKLFDEIEKVFQMENFYDHSQFAIYLYANLRFFRTMSEAPDRVGYESYLGFLRAGYDSDKVEELLTAKVSYSHFEQLGITSDTPVEWVISLLNP